MSKLSIDKYIFKSIKKTHVIVLSLVAFLALGTQILVQKRLHSTDEDVKVISIISEQRVFIQNISKKLLLLNDEKLYSSKVIDIDLQETLSEWKSNHNLLQNNLHKLPKDASLNTQFSKVTIVFEELLATYHHVVSVSTPDQKEQSLKAFLQIESSYLKEMSAYIDLYKNYTLVKINAIKNIQYVTFTILLIVLLVAYFVSLRPIRYRVKRIVSDLLEAENKALTMARKANDIVVEKKEILGELQLLQKAIDQNMIFARIDRHGYIIHSARKLKQLIYQQDINNQYIIYESLGLSETDSQVLRGKIESNKGAILNHEFHVNLKGSAIEWIDLSVFPIVKRDATTEYIVIGMDITSRKKAQSKIEALNIERIASERVIQKEKSSMIVEAQEEERKRIAKDIHDSIGQMLTALKFNLECMEVGDTEKLSAQIEALKKYTKNIIIGVRMATFNLTPPELLHHGVISAIQKMVNQLNKYSDAKIIFHSELEDSRLRFDSLVETNLYRVTQESINNAIKYAQSTYIYVSLKKTEELLSISITDDGKGFDMLSIPKKPKGGTDGGMGLFFMRERMSYINGRVFFFSEPGKGTRVVLNYPINTKND